MGFSTVNAPRALFVSAIPEAVALEGRYDAIAPVGVSSVDLTHGRKRTLHLFAVDGLRAPRTLQTEADQNRRARRAAAICRARRRTAPPRVRRRKSPPRRTATRAASLRENRNQSSAATSHRKGRG